MSASSSATTMRTAPGTEVSTAGVGRGWVSLTGQSLWDGRHRCVAALPRGGYRPLSPALTLRLAASSSSWAHEVQLHLSRLTPREMTRTASTSADTDSKAISILARGESGIVSVGLKAEELVIDT